MTVQRDGSRPATKTARQAQITALLTARSIRSQAELAALLAADGVQVTQATLSRDLVELGAVRVRGKDGALVYAVPGEGGGRAPQTGLTQEILDARLGRLCAELLVTAEASANIVILRTPPGAANFLALAIDHSIMPSVLGSIAGDDTVMIVTRDPNGGAAVAERFLNFAQDPLSGAEPLLVPGPPGPTRDASPETSSPENPSPNRGAVEPTHHPSELSEEHTQ